MRGNEFSISFYQEWTFVIIHFIYFRLKESIWEEKKYMNNTPLFIILSRKTRHLSSKNISLVQTKHIMQGGRTWNLTSVKIQRSKGIRKWPTNWCTSQIMIHKFPSFVDYNHWLKRLDTQLNESTNQNKLVLTH